MAINTKSIDLLLRGVRAEFAYVADQAEKQSVLYDANAYLDATSKTGGLFIEENAIGRQRWEAIAITGVSKLQPTGELQPFPETNYSPSYITSVEPSKFARRITVSRESVERRDTYYQKALNEAAKLQFAWKNTQAFNRFNRFNKAFTVVSKNDEGLFDYGDGVALCSNSHPDLIGGTHSNIVTPSDISPTSIEAMILVLQNQVDDIGEPMPMGGSQKFIVVPPAKVRKAKENIESEWTVDTANNNINVWRGQGWILVQSPYLGSNYGGSDTAWFIVDANFSPLRDIVFKSVDNSVWFDDNVKAFKYDIEYQHRVGAIDYRGIVGNQGV